MDKYENQATACASPSLSHTVVSHRQDALSWAQSFLGLNAYNTTETTTVDDLIATARKIEAYLDGGTSV